MIVLLSSSSDDAPLINFSIHASYTATCTTSSRRRTIARGVEWLQVDRHGTRDVGARPGTVESPFVWHVTIVNVSYTYYAEESAVYEGPFWSSGDTTYIIEKTLPRPSPTYLTAARPLREVTRCVDTGFDFELDDDAAVARGALLSLSSLASPSSALEEVTPTAATSCNASVTNVRSAKAGVVRARCFCRAVVSLWLSSGKL